MTGSFQLGRNSSTSLGPVGAPVREPLDDSSPPSRTGFADAPLAAPATGVATPAAAPAATGAALPDPAGSAAGSRRTRTVPPEAASLPKRIASARGFLISFWIRRAI